MIKNGALVEKKDLKKLIRKAKKQGKKIEKFEKGGEKMIEIYIYGLINSVLVLLLLGYKRVFEVKAKFSLDALPGHQMVLDSDKQLDTKMKNEKEKLLYNNVDKLGFWKGLSHIIYNYIFIETIAVFILLIFSKRFLNEQKTAILLVISISTVIHISVCSFLSVKLISYNKFFNKTKR